MSCNRGAGCPAQINRQPPAGRGERAAVLLEELTVNGDKVVAEKAPAFLCALFAIADELSTDTPLADTVLTNQASPPSQFHSTDGQSPLTL
jgi:hypothetical protein